MDENKEVKVFETGAGKWIWIDDGRVKYTSDKDRATSFTDALLKDADRCFHDFSIYKDTLRAVPKGTNGMPQDCASVRTYIKNSMAGEEW